MNNPPAFPRTGFWTQFRLTNVDFDTRPQEGMTLRDYFAAKALQGLLSNNFQGPAYDAAPLSATAYTYADAMLKERDKR